MTRIHPMFLCFLLHWFFFLLCVFMGVERRAPTLCFSVFSLSWFLLCVFVEVRRPALTLCFSTFPLSWFCSLSVFTLPRLGIDMKLLALCSTTKGYNDATQHGRSDAITESRLIESDFWRCRIFQCHFNRIHFAAPNHALSRVITHISMWKVFIHLCDILSELCE